MRPSVFGIWVGLLVLVLGTAVGRFWFSGALVGPALPGLVFNFAILTIFVVAVWLGALAFLETRHRRQVLALQAGTPGSLAFPSYPTRAFGEAARRPAPRSTLEAVDLVTVLVSSEGVAVWRRGGDSTGQLLELPREQVVGVRTGSLPGRFGAHPAIAIVTQQDAGLLEFVLPVFQPARPFRRASPAQTADLVERATAALGR